MSRTRKSAPKTYRGKKFWKIAIYIRLSREDGNDESLSVANQRKIILEYIESSFEGEYEIIDEYVDATDIIGLKQNPTNGRRFSPIFSFIGHFRYKTRKCYF